MDQMVLNTQKWLNKTYQGKAGYKSVGEDGVTGWGTMTALITALQIEIGIESPNGVFGPGTTTKFSTLSVNASITNKNFILQGALYCKGYNPQEFTGVFTNLTKQAVMAFQTDAGLSNVNGAVDVVLMKSLLAMDAFTLLNYGSYTGTVIIRTIQQYLNKKYISNKYFASDIGLVPCDGIYGRSTNKALLYGLQIEEGIPVPNGVFGPSTTSLCPTIPSQSREPRYVYLLQAALYCNGENPNGFDGGFGNGAIAAIKNFQLFSELVSDGVAGKQTWASLLVSTGDPTRKGKACDTSDVITDARAKTLINDGRAYVGRYLTGKYKITPDELAVIYKNNLKLIPLMQVSADRACCFSSTSGLRDALDALTMARFNGFADGTLIYFSIDYDALTSDLNGYIEPYFAAVNKVFNNFSANPNKYRIGVYAPRAICTALYKKGYTSSSYVSDMSTGFSSNLGTRLPENWSFDQIHEYMGGIGTGNGNLVLDNVIARTGHVEYCSSVNPKYSYTNLMTRINSNPLVKAIGVEFTGMGTLVFTDTLDLKISLNVSSKLVIGDESYSTIQIKNGKFNSTKFQSDLTSLTGSLSKDGAAQLATSMKVLENVDAVVSVSTNSNYIKIEVGAKVDSEDIWPLPLTVTLCIEIKRNDNIPLRTQVNSIVDTFTSMAYNTVNGAISIGNKVVTCLGYILTGVIIVIGAVALIIALIVDAAAVTGIAVFILLANIVLKFLNNDSTSA